MKRDPMIEDIKNRLRDLALGDIERASLGGAKIGAFILGSCFIDYLAGYRYGKKTTRDDYLKFVGAYMSPFYNPKKLYTDLRCKLVHNYSEGGSYVFTDGNSSEHGTRLSSGRLVVNLEDFVADLVKAMEKYFHDLDTQPTLQRKAMKRHKTIGLLMVFASTHGL